MPRRIYWLQTLFVVAVLVTFSAVGCLRRPSGKIVGSRSAETWTGSAYYLLIEDADGKQHEVSVSREEYHGLRHGDAFPGD